MFARNTLALSRTAREKNCNRVQVRTSKAPNPFIRTIPTRIEKDLCTGWHALSKFFWESSQGLLVHAKHAKPLPRECNRYPPLFAFDGLPCFLNRGNFVQNASQPGPSLRRLTK